MSTNSVEKENDQKADNELDYPLDYSIEHPLQNIWTLWYFENDRNLGWSENQKEIATFQTVEGFWSLYNHMKPASELRQGTDYSIFKKGILPMWEDKANQAGGRWILSLEKKQRSSELDRYWLDVILCLIGEAFEHSEEICGAVINVRPKGDKIGVWTADATKSTANLEIGKKLKERLHIPNRTQLGYQPHKDSMDKGASGSRFSYTV